jgi:hypothetical protein
MAKKIASIIKMKTMFEMLNKELAQEAHSMLLM